MKVFGLFVFIFLCFQAYPLESKLNGTIIGELLKKITNLRDKKQVTVKLLQEILHKAGLNYGKRKRNDLIKLVAPLWQGVHKITNDKRYKL